MSLESQVQDLVTQTQQLDTTIQNELIDVNTDVSKLRNRVTALEIRVGMPDDDSGGIPGGGGGSSSNPGTNLGNDIIQIDTDNNLLWLWNPDTNSWVSIPFTEISPPIALDIQAIIDQANNAITAGIDERIQQIADSIQATVLSTQQTQITGLAEQIETIGTTLNGNTAALQVESVARANADTALAAQVTNLVADMDANHQAFLSFQAAVVADPEGAGAQYLQQMQAQLDANTATLENEEYVRAQADLSLASQVSTLVSSVDAAQAAVQQEVTARASADSAISSSVTNLASRVGTAEGAIQSLQTVTSGLNSNTVSNITTLTSTVNGLSTTVQDVATAVNGIEGKRTLAINANGKVTGIELLGGGTVGSQIKFQANNFIFYDPSTGIESVPFAISGGKTYINMGIIKDADIGTLKLAGNSVIVPVSVTRSDEVYSTGLVNSAPPVSVLTASITMPQACTLTYLYSGKQHYGHWNPVVPAGSFNGNYKGELNTSIDIYLNGTLLRNHAGAAVENTLTIVGAVPVAAGTHTIEIKWAGTRYDSLAFVNLMYRSLTLLGAMR